MKLHLLCKTSIGDAKRQFAKQFPFLKLEFFSAPHEKNGGSLMEQRLDDHLLLAELKTFHREGSLTMQPSMGVGEFESLLQAEFGLSVQVFRRSGSIWLETIHTDKLSLAKQNDMGEATCRPIRVNLATLFL